MHGWKGHLGKERRGSHSSHLLLVLRVSGKDPTALTQPPKGLLVGQTHQSCSRCETLPVYFFFFRLSLTYQFTSVSLSCCYPVVVLLHRSFKAHPPISLRSASRPLHSLIQTFYPFSWTLHSPFTISVTKPEPLPHPLSPQTWGQTWGSPGAGRYPCHARRLSLLAAPPWSSPGSRGPPAPLQGGPDQPLVSRSLESPALSREPSEDSLQKRNKAEKKINKVAISSLSVFLPDFSLLQKVLQRSLCLLFADKSPFHKHTSFEQDLLQALFL